MQGFQKRKSWQLPNKKLRPNKNLTEQKKMFRTGKKYNIIS